jgi:myosin heavy subunit
MEEEEMDVSTFDYDDLIRLPAMTLEGVKANLYNRHQRDQIYTYTGAILLSVNPYKTIEGLYTKQKSASYHGQALGDLPPHVFAIADSAFSSLLETKMNQSIIISGESGAGKTEATKLMLRYLTGRSSHHTVVEEMILESNPILESFGNAQTVRNYNSSRFGKYIELMVSQAGTVCEGRVTDYLLEKSRIVVQDEGERGYHIFYQLVNCCSPQEREKYMLGVVADYKCLQPTSERWTLQADTREWNALLTAMHFLGITQIERDSIFSVVAAVLHLGNIDFKVDEDNDDASVVSTRDPLSKAAAQIGVTPEGLERALCWRTNIIAGQKIESPFPMRDAKQTLLALQKSLYSLLFSWIVRRVNVALKAGAKAVNEENEGNSPGELNTIGCLDIFGFEDFKHNSFEQLCINYVNEKLQLQFNDHVFKAEQELYISEGIEVPNVGYGDNKPCLELIEGKIGIFALLSEESRFPKSTDDSFLKKIAHQHGKHDYFSKHPRSQVTFKVMHYAGEVEYNVTGFLEKNRDKLSDDAQELVKSSSIPFYPSLFRRSCCC